ncbi:MULTISPECIES: hypothetical protein [unclassified Polaribacter]|uniref:hypothetical protein n=1 Tax=unclassified Polaribacter TaxID=196858 RepID=UPI0011BFA683|nr:MULTISPECIES: hypothetical protein [unclassified Polaribacter]TXD45767.1 hypothetical protein ES043_18575 [Polaribacter sp. IC063]TXD54759.1 hypothetical protein ES044_18345 [Polaribacter sp. IC066]
MKIKDKALNFQYQYSRIFTLGLNRKRFESLPKSNSLFALNNSRNTFITIGFTLFSCGLFFSGIIEGFINGNEITTEFIFVFFVAHPIVGTIGLRQFLWLTNGRQELRVDNEKITLSKKGTFLTKNRTFELKHVENIRKEIDINSLPLFEKILRNIKLNRQLLFSHIIGEIIFDYKGKKVKLFNELTENQKTELITEINKLKEKPTPNTVQN